MLLFLGKGETFYSRVYKKRLTFTSWRTDRLKENFEILLGILIIKYGMINSNGKNGAWNGQTKSEFEKNYKRVKDIVDKADGDEDKAISLARTQANRIMDEWKALNRAMSAKQMKQEHIFEVFFQRAYELGSVSKQDYRNYKLERLGL